MVVYSYKIELQGEIDKVTRIQNRNHWNEQKFIQKVVEIIGVLFTYFHNHMVLCSIPTSNEYAIMS